MNNVEKAEKMSEKQTGKENRSGDPCASAYMQASKACASTGAVREGSEQDLFDSAEQVWFWFIMAQQARNEGARFTKGQGLYNRPCEPLDVLNILDRLYRKRILLRDHLLVLRHYGRRLMPPDPYRVKEMRAHTIWGEAMERLEEVFINKGIIFPQYLKSAMEAAE